jgi:hypothetical protein
VSCCQLSRLQFRLTLLLLLLLLLHCWGLRTQLPWGFVNPAKAIYAAAPAAAADLALR